jgi:hypothetical protein
MAAQTDITVKMNDGATNITYSKLSPAGAAGEAATWRSESIGGVALFRPFLELLSKWNSAKTTRRLEATYVYPYAVTDTTDSTQVKKGEIKLQLVGHVLQSVPQAVIDEAVSQGLNCFADNSFKTALKTGQAPN